MSLRRTNKENINEYLDDDKYQKELDKIANETKEKAEDIIDALESDITDSYLAHLKVTTKIDYKKETTTLDDFKIFCMKILIALNWWLS